MMPGWYAGLAITGTRLLCIRARAISSATVGAQEAHADRTVATPADRIHAVRAAIALGLEGRRPPGPHPHIEH